MIALALILSYLGIGWLCAFVWGRYLEPNGPPGELMAVLLLWPVAMLGAILHGLSLLLAKSVKGKSR